MDKTLDAQMQEASRKTFGAHALTDGILSGIEDHLRTLLLAQAALRAGVQQQVPGLEKECNAVVNVTADILNRIGEIRASLHPALLSANPVSDSQH